MHILLTAATSLEIQPTLDALGSLQALRCDRLITGVGALPATWSLLRQIDSERPDLILQAGIAGSFTPLTPGETLAIREETLGDLGVWEDGRFKSLFDLGLARPDQPPFSEGRLVNPYTHLLAFTGLRPVSAITVNEITTDPARIAWHRGTAENSRGAPFQQFERPAVETMEGAALHYVGLREKIPFLQIRSVSNEVGIRDKSRWDIGTAVNALNGYLLSLLQKLEKAGIEKAPSDLLKPEAALWMPDSN
jgi:futalosine hydrolase